MSIIDVCQRFVKIFNLSIPSHLIANNIAWQIEHTLRGQKKAPHFTQFLTLVPIVITYWFYASLIL